MRAPAQVAVLVKKLREALDAMLAAKVRRGAAALQDGGKAAAAAGSEQQLLGTIASLLAEADGARAR